MIIYLTRLLHALLSSSESSVNTVISHQGRKVIITFLPVLLPVTLSTIVHHRCSVSFFPSSPSSYLHYNYYCYYYYYCCCYCYWHHCLRLKTSRCTLRRRPSATQIRYGSVQRSHHRWRENDPSSSRKQLVLPKKKKKKKDYYLETKAMRRPIDDCRTHHDHPQSCCSDSSVDHPSIPPSRYHYSYYEEHPSHRHDGG